MPKKRIYTLEEMYDAKDSYQRQANNPKYGDGARKVGKEAVKAISKKIKREVGRKYPKH